MQRVFTLTATVKDPTNTPVPNAPCSIQMLSPTGTPAVDGNGDIVQTAPVLCTTNASGQLVAADGVSAVQVDYPGDYQSAYVNAQVLVYLNGQGILSPVGFSYASSIDASTWINTPSTAGLVTMRVVYTNDADQGVPGILCSVALSQPAVVVASGQIAAGSAQPVLALTGSDGTVTFPLNPNSLLNPSNLTYTLTISGESQPFYFTVPAVVDTYKGAWNSATAYVAASGANNGNVVLEGGVLYRCILGNTNQMPPNVTYWQVVSGLPTDLITDHLNGAAQVGTIAIGEGGIAADSSVATGTYTNPPVTLQDQLRQLTQIQARHVTASTDTATYDDDVLDLDGTSNTVTETLPSAVGWTKFLLLKCISTAHTVTVNTTGGQTIDGSASLTPALNVAYLLYSDGANWRIGATANVGGGGSAAFSYVLKTANYTISGSDSGIEVDASGGNVIITLPTAVGVTQFFAIKRIDSSTNTVTVATTSSQTIDGNSSLALVAQWQEYVVGSNNANWRIEAAYLVNPLTSLGDLIKSSALGVPVRLPIGLPGQVPSPVGGDVQWLQAVDDGGFTDPTTHEGDLLYRKATLTTALAIGFIGDSITQGFGISTAPPASCGADLTSASVTVSAVNEAVSGTQTADWLPGSTNYTNAIAAFAAAGVRVVHIMLGTNDSAASVSGATYRANLRSIVNALVQAGYVVVLAYPPYSTAAGRSPTLQVAYQTQINSLVDGVRVRQGDTSSYLFFQANPGLYQGDGVHPTQAGANDLGQLWATALRGVAQALTEETTLQALPAGANGQVLTLAAGYPAWQNSPTGFANPMTHLGALIAGGASGTPTELVAGSNGQALQIVAGVPAWVNPSTGFTNPMSHLGSLISGGTGGAAQELLVGTEGQQLSVTGGVPAWANDIIHQPVVLSVTAGVPDFVTLGNDIVVL